MMTEIPKLESDHEEIDTRIILQGDQEVPLHLIFNKYRL